MIALRPTTDTTNLITPNFLISLALLLYVATTLFLYIVVNRLSQEQLHKYWAINQFANIVVNLIISIAFFISRSQNKSKPPENISVDFTFPNNR